MEDYFLHAFLIFFVLYEGAFWMVLRVELEKENSRLVE